VGRNLHRWKLSLNDEHLLRVLEEAARTLEWAWKTDMQDRKSYPANTDHALCGIKEQIKRRLDPPKMGQENSSIKPPLPPPTCLSELVSEGTIESVYEQQNDENYKDALKQAALWNDGDLLVWRKIWRAIDAAYQIDRYGYQLAPKPRVHFLHRNLLEIANMTGIAELTHSGIVEFLDDTCPCGKTHKTDALRKLKDRMFGET
jgi:hypothetical protein